MPRLIERTLITILIACAGAGRVRADGPAPRADQPWRVTDLLEDADLDGRFVMQVAGSADGTVWLATADGLRACDGYRWRRYSTADGLPSDFVRSVHVRGDEVWIGTDHGVVVRRKGRFEPLNGGPAGPNVRRIVETSDGSLWFCCDTWLRPEVASGLSRLRDGAWTTYTERDGLPSNYVQDLYEDRAGRLYAFTLDGTVEWRDGRWREVAGWAGPRHAIWAAAENDEGDLLFAAERATYARRDGIWRRVETPVGDLALAKSLCVVDGAIMCVVKTETRHAFHRWTGHAFTPVSAAWSRDGYAEHARQLPDGSVWVVGHELVARWTPRTSRWTALDWNGTQAAVDHAGRPWFGGPGGALSVVGGAWVRHPEMRGVLSLADPHAAWTWEGDRITRHAATGTVTAGPEVTGLRRPEAHLVDARGRSWFRGEDALGRTVVVVRDEVAWHPIDLGPAMIRRPTDWSADREGRVWIVGTDDGRRTVQALRLESPVGFTRFDLSEVMSVSGSRIHADAAGGVWLYGEFGLYRLDGDAWTRIEGFPGGMISAVTDHDADLWVLSCGVTGGRRGISRLRDGRWWHRVTDARRKIGVGAGNAPIFVGGATLYFTNADETDPVSSLDVPLVAAVQAATRVANGDVWVAAGDALLRYRGDGDPPETELLSAAREVARGEPLVVAAAGIERFRARRDSRFTYSWRFDDDPWSRFGPLPVGGVRVPDAVGTHRLEVRARDEDGDIDPTPALATIEVLPVPLQSRAWFLTAVVIVIAVIAVLAGLLLFSRNRIRRYATHLEVSVERESLAAHLSDARLRAAVDNIPSLVFEADSQGRAEYVNDRWQQMTGLPADRALGFGWSEAVHPDDRERVLEAWTDSVGTSTDWQAEFRFLRPDGEATWVIGRAVPVRNGRGRVECYLGLCTDITERKRHEVHQRLLMNELDHRVKNNLSALLALLAITRSSAKSIDDFVSTLAGRIESMATAHATLARAQWRTVPVRQVLGDTLDHVEEARHRLTMTGPDVHLPARMAGPFALCVHELATNARKHGVLAKGEGLIEVKWSRGDEGPLHLEWSERNGGVATPGSGERPIAPGAGLQLVRGLVEHDLAGSVAFDLDDHGFRCTMELSMAE